MAERYGSELAGALPEATVLGFDDYGAIGDRLDDVLAGRPGPAHPARPPHAAADQPGRSAPPRRGRGRRPGHPRPRLAAPQAAGVRPDRGLKLASGCDRRCAFCAIPTFRGAFVSRPPAEVLGEAQWLARRASPSSCWSARTRPPTARTSATCGRWRSCCRSSRRSRASRGCGSPTCSRPSCGPALLEVIAGTEGVAPYFDLSFQHSSPTLLRRMRRFGGTDDFLALIERARALAPRGRLPHQRHPRLPRGDRGRRRRARALPHRGPPRRGRRLRLLRRGGHRGDRPARQARPGRDRRPRPADHRPGRGAHRAARRGPDRRAGRGAAHRGPLRRRRARASGSATPPTRTPTPTGRRRSRACPTARGPASCPRRGRGHRGRRPRRPGGRPRRGAGRSVTVVTASPRTRPPHRRRRRSWSTCPTR